MTCIVGLVEDGDVYIGADSLSGNAGGKNIVTNPKIVRVTRPHTGYPTDVLMGYTSSWRMGQLLATMKLPHGRGTKDTFEWLCTQFVDTVRKQLKEGGWATVNNNQESGGEFLVAFDGRLFKVQSDFSVLESAIGYDATGSGEDWALGSLFTTSSVRTFSSEKRLTTALEAASKFNPFVAPPFHIARLVERSLVTVAA